MDTAILLISIATLIVSSIGLWYFVYHIYNKQIELDNYKYRINNIYKRLVEQGLIDMYVPGIWNGKNNVNNLSETKRIAHITNECATEYNEVYTMFYRCTHCHKNYIKYDFKYCPICGYKLIWDKSVKEPE